jgi:hypothetical protein
MFKKMYILITCFSFFSISPTFAMLDIELGQTEDRHTVKAVQKDVIIESATPEDLGGYKAILEQLPRFGGYPAINGSEGRFTAQNLDRQRADNPFHLYSITSGEENIGFLQLGRMPCTAYEEGPNAENPTAHHPIIEKFISLGLTQKIDQDAGFKKENIQRVENRGAAAILPMFRPDVSEEVKQQVISSTFELIRHFTSHGKTLPVENTIPHVAVGLFHPDDPIVNTFRQMGFEVDDNPEFRWFYPDAADPRRVMVERKIQL